MVDGDGVERRSHEEEVELLGNPSFWEWFDGGTART